MGHLPYAFSVHHFISTVGADAGFASIVGLAILVLLFFAQARETTSLRDELADAGERVRGLEARLAQLTRGGAAGAPVSAAAPAAAAVEARQGAPAATAAPARPGVPLQPAGNPAPAAAPVPAMAGAGAPPGVGAPAQGAATRLVPDLTTVQPPVTAAATAAGAASAVAERTGPAAPPPAPAPVAARGNGGPVSPAEPPARVQIRSGAAGAAGAAGTAAARRPGGSARLVAQSAPAGPSRGRRVLAGLLALALVAAVVVVLVLVTSGGGSSSHTASTASAPVSNAPVVHRHHTPSGGASVVPSSVTVAVLNGTATNGLAHRVALKVTANGFKQGNVTTGVDQTRTATTVAYLPGQRAAALAVAATLKLGSASVAPADQTTRTVACQGLSTSACSAQTVIVTVGSDLANIQ